jgi:AAA15 family ATPase/GTPase
VKIKQVSIHHFRSVEDAALKNIRDFNVLIGQNNSGKSNLLSCVDLFFSSMRPGDVIVDRPRIGAPLDFYNRVIANPIEITVFFLSPSRSVMHSSRTLCLKCLK